jgi:peptide/nickel transport system ATP-binding protein
MTDPILSVQNLSTAFRVEGAWREVVRNVSFTIGPQETLALVGESGSGKSVTALSLMRLTARDSSRVTGSVMLGSRDLLRLPEPEMRQVRGDEIAMIFQEPMTSLNPVLTIGFQVSEALILHRGHVASRGGGRDGAAPREGAHPGRESRASTNTRTAFRAACASAS